ncbi:hypothetical protein G3N58_08470 [Paraburkholderia sp. Ac-20342]|uniref:hypothetical protein n=1 Tax=Paraburkholderia sp. Ac-20342 TaxID=2703889 RepID=UPI0019816965|nr:hypothetical protein [Paraburkholderia sp. Ac-20342]MBN3846861.1 hypothetical protein [Paraburkholderia sp. Ac-20342]
MAVETSDWRIDTIVHRLHCFVAERGDVRRYHAHKKLAAATGKIGQERKRPENPVQGKKSRTNETGLARVESAKPLLALWCRGRDLNP